MKAITQVNELRATLNSADETCLLKLGDQTYRLEANVVAALKALSVVPEEVKASQETSPGHLREAQSSLNWFSPTVSNLKEETSLNETSELNRNEESKSFLVKSPLKTAEQVSFMEQPNSSNKKLHANPNVLEFSSSSSSKSSFDSHNVSASKF